MTQYLIHLLIALDCVGTALLGGWPGETMSSYAWRLERQGKPGGRLCRPAIDWLFAWQRKPGGHCFDAWMSMKGRLSMPPELR